MKIKAITTALKGAKLGLILHSLHDKDYGKPFCGCAVGELLHFAGLNRRDIDRDPDTGDASDYSTIQDGLLGRVYGLNSEEISEFHCANDDFFGDESIATMADEQIARRDYMVRFAGRFHASRKAGLAPVDAGTIARKEASA